MVEIGPDTFSDDPFSGAPFRNLPEERSTNWIAIGVVMLVVIIVAAAVFLFLRSRDGDDAGGKDAAAGAEVDDAASETAGAGNPGTATGDEVPVGDTEQGPKDGTQSDGTQNDDTEGEDTGDGEEQLSQSGTPPPPTTEPVSEEELGPTTLDTRSTVSTVGLDSVIFGMTVATAQRAAGTLLVEAEPASECYHVTPRNAPQGIVFTVYKSTIERVDINRGPITTRSGVGIGTPEENVVSLFGDSLGREVRADGSVDLIFVPNDPGDADFRVVFNIADGAVKSYKSGRLPLIMTATGCTDPAGN